MPVRFKGSEMSARIGAEQTRSASRAEPRARWKLSGKLSTLARLAALLACWETLKAGLELLSGPRLPIFRVDSAGISCKSAEHPRAEHPRERAFQIFVAWLEGCGGQIHPSVTFGQLGGDPNDASATNFGLFARQPLPVNSTVASVPHNCILRQGEMQDRLSRSAAGKELMRRLPKEYVPQLFLLLEAHDPRSPWRFYLDSLPGVNDFESFPTALNDEQINEALNGSAFSDELRKERARMRSLFDRIQEVVKNLTLQPHQLAARSFERWAWAWHLKDSRVWKVRQPPSNAATKRGDAKNTGAASSESSRTRGLFPVADLLLHSDQKNVIVRQQAPVMKLVTVSPVAAGAALTDCYGCSAGVSNHALLSSWGFVPAELERELNGAFVRVGYGQCSHNYYLQMHAKKPGKKEPAHRLFSFLRQLTRLNTHDGLAEAQARVRARAGPHGRGGGSRSATTCAAVGVNRSVLEAASTVERERTAIGLLLESLRTELERYPSPGSPEGDLPSGINGRRPASSAYENLVRIHVQARFALQRISASYARLGAAYSKSADSRAEGGALNPLDAAREMSTAIRSDPILQEYFTLLELEAPNMTSTAAPTKPTIDKKTVRAKRTAKKSAARHDARSAATL